MSMAAVGGSNHLSSRYRGSFLETKKPRHEANHAPPPSAMLEMCVHIRPHTPYGIVFLLNTGVCIFPYLVWKRIQIVVSEIKVPVTATVPVHGKYVKCSIKMYRLLPMFIVSMASVLMLFPSLEQNSVLWDWPSWLRFVVVFLSTLLRIFGILH
jgi:hypothetical protein